MNFAPYTGHIPPASSIPSIQHFAAKFGYETSGTVVQETRYQSGNTVQFVGPGTAVVDGVKYRQAESVVMVSNAPTGTVALAGLAPIHTVNTGVKYQTISASSSVNLGNVTYGGQTFLAELAPAPRDRDDIHQDVVGIIQQDGTEFPGQVVAVQPLQSGSQQLLVVLHEPKEAAAFARALRQDNSTTNAEFITIGDVDPSTWQTFSGGVAEYLSALPLPLHQMIKLPVVDEKTDVPTEVVNETHSVPTVTTVQGESVEVQTAPEEDIDYVEPEEVVVPVCKAKRKKKKSQPKERKPKPKPGEIRLTTALDGSTLYCCPQCHMAYPDQELLDQHLVGHTTERRFICDICNAALKRKDHLTRHKQSHNPDRPHECSVCRKAFKRKEQLTLHFIIHSGDKQHVCNDCGKGFYRKDHLRKHARSHIARRVKSEMSGASSD